MINVTVVVCTAIVSFVVGFCTTIICATYINKKTKDE